MSSNRFPSSPNPLIRAHYSNATGTSAANNTVTTVPINAIDFQTDPGFSIGLSAVVLPYTGVYRMHGLVKWATSADQKERLARITNNTSSVVMGQTEVGGNNVVAATEVSAIWVCNAADTVILQGRQQSGAGLNIIGGSDGSASWIYVEFLGIVP